MTTLHNRRAAQRLYKIYQEILLPAFSQTNFDDQISTELAIPLLTERYLQLWLVAKKFEHHIDALRGQTVNGRPIIPSKDQSLHLTWNRNKIYVKPVPLFLLKHEFWVRHL